MSNQVCDANSPRGILKTPLGDVFVLMTIHHAYSNSYLVCMRDDDSDCFEVTDLTMRQWLAFNDNN